MSTLIFFLNLDKLKSFCSAIVWYSNLKQIFRKWCEELSHFIIRNVCNTKLTQVGMVWSKNSRCPNWFNNKSKYFYIHKYKSCSDMGSAVRNIKKTLILLPLSSNKYTLLFMVLLLVKIKISRCPSRLAQEQKITRHF